MEDAEQVPVPQNERSAVDGVEEPAENPEAEDTPVDAYPRACILNFGKWTDKSKLRDFLNKLEGLQYRNVHKNRTDSYGFVTFDSVDARTRGMEILNKTTYKGKLLEVKVAPPRKFAHAKRQAEGGERQDDRSQKRRKTQEKSGSRDGDEEEAGDEEDEGTSLSLGTAEPKDVADVVAPWRHVPYDRQLAQKEVNMRRVLIKIIRATRKEFIKRAKSGGGQGGKNKGGRMGQRKGGGEKEGGAAIELPSWLQSGCYLYTAGRNGLFRVNTQDRSRAESEGDKADNTWSRVAEGGEFTSLFSYQGRLLAVTPSGSIVAIDVQDHGRDEDKGLESGGSAQWAALATSPAPLETAALHGGLVVAVSVEGTLYTSDLLHAGPSHKWNELKEGTGFMSLCSHSGDLLALKKDGALVQINGAFLEGKSDAMETASWVGLAEASSVVSHASQILVVLKSGEVRQLKQPLRVEVNELELEELSPSLALPPLPLQKGEKPLLADHNGLTVAVRDIVPSPVVTGYRNKCEFSAGYDLHGQPCVGFRVGLYKEGSITVESPENCPNVPSVMKALCARFQECVRQSSLAPYNRLTHQGVWRQLTARNSERTGGLMAIIQVNLQGVSDEDVNGLKQALKEYLTDEGSGSKLTSLYLQDYQGLSSPPTDHPMERLWGDEFILEELMGLKFRVSPDAFFQVNTPAAEILYKLVRDNAALGHESTVYDVCCGTGTIGLCTAKEVEKVVGIELCKAATEDAEANAKLNEITNAEFICSRAEAVLDKLLKAQGKESQERKKPISAIVDPPRSGLHHDCTRAIRACSPIKRLVYVSCNPTGSLVDDIRRLCGPKSQNVRGEPFRPTAAIPVDLFPLTPHCELVLILER